ncbi:HNH endonuclease family protein [Luteimicrobium sp. NPDC057192]|uniref:HNH endonuclease family protein n=1 Tax=Luteimicrobium sp. NPDC057192 TaxID=3346042 RepID=UPI003635A83D
MPRPTPARSPARRRTRLATALALLAAVVAVAVGAPYVVAHARAARYPVAEAELARARQELADLPVRDRASSDGYAREQFGQAWADVDHNGCDTRDDVLRRDLATPTYKTGGDICTVESGTLHDPYTGRTIRFRRGPDSAAVQIDHVVALADAWQTGAQDLPPATRLALANDPANLLAVDGPANQDKSAGDASEWLPPNAGYRCAYVVRQLRVKAAYGLWVTRAEHDAMARTLRTCAVVP